MKKIVFLGCENSHSSVFLGFINQDKRFSDIEVLGVYSHEKAPMENLNEKYGAKIMSSYDEAVEEADAIVVTARHGDNHYKYAAPYIKKGIPMFIDKPITVNEDEGVKFMRECKENGVRVTGGSCCIFEPGVVELRRVTIIIHGDGYCIVYTNEKDSEEGIGGELPYLKENDMIVTSGNDLYDGKLLD